MAHYAFLNENNVVVEVITGINETELIEGLEPEIWYGNFRGKTCKRTSYNGNIRKQYAGIGYTYDAVNDVFITPQPYPSWLLDENFDWQAPVLKPESGDWFWNEYQLEWVIVPQPYPSWLLDENSYWRPPTPRPVGIKWVWSEETLSWIEIE